VLTPSFDFSLVGDLQLQFGPMYLRSHLSAWRRE